jgi:aspartate kinase
MSEGLIVQKYGGSSLSSPHRIQSVAEKIASRTRDDHRIIATVSAMGSTTDRLVRLAHEVSSHPSRRELDMLLTVGERISMALLSMALNSIGCRAISFTGSQSGIVTNVSHTRALIEEIRAARIEEALSTGHVVIVAGFQGVSRTKEITTLGRGGSDTTAVALAARFGASQCEIYSDVAGVYTADPRIVKMARPLPRISYDEMLELAVLGAKVLHFRAAELARRYRVPLRLLSTFDDAEGTQVCEGKDMEHESITSVTSQKSVALVRVDFGLDVPALRALLDRIVEREIRLMSYQRLCGEPHSSLVFVVEQEEVPKVREAAEELSSADASIDVLDGLAAVSVVGSGLSSSPRAIARIEKLVADEGVPVRYVRTSALSVTCLVPAADCKRTVALLHSALVEAEGVRPGAV